jgi:hypothetical protein
MTRRLLLLLALAPAACGESEPPTPKLTPDEAAAQAVALRYMHAVASRDWKTACATRTEAEQARFAEAFGTCEQGLARAFKGKPVEAYKATRARTVRVQDGVAGIHLTRGLGAGKLAAVREHGAWRLEDMPDAQIP